MPAGEWPHSFSAIQAFGFEFSQSEYICRWQLPAVAAGDRERHDHAVADLQVLDLRADLDDLAHELVAEDVALLHRRDEAVVEVQVRAADRRRGDPDDRVARVQDLRVGHVARPARLLCRSSSCALIAPPVRFESARAISGRDAGTPRHGRAAARALARRDPSRLPSERTTSPVSITCLKRRRSSCTCCSGSSPNSLATARAERAARRVVAQLDADLGAASAGRRLEARPSRRCRTSAPGSERQAISSFGRSSVISASHSTVVPAGALRLPVRAPLVEHLHRLEVAHEPRQVLEVAPEAVELLGGPVDRDRLVHLDRGRSPGRAARRVGRRPSRTAS